MKINLDTEISDYQSYKVVAVGDVAHIWKVDYNSPKHVDVAMDISGGDLSKITAAGSFRTKNMKIVIEETYSTSLANAKCNACMSQEFIDEMAIKMGLEIDDE